MTELGLIVGIDVVGLVFALLIGRGVSVRDAAPPAMRRLGNALERAARAFLWREYSLVAGSTLLLLIVSVTLSATLGSGGGGESRLLAAFWGGAGLCLGALGAVLAGYVGTLLSVRGSGRAAAASGTSVDSALAIALRAAGAAGVLSESLSGLFIASLFGLLFAIKGGFALPAEQALSLAKQVVHLLPSFALGATASALVLQRGGGTFHAASGVGADQAGERDAGLEHDDTRNPAVVAELVGDHVGASATRNLDGFASASVANVAAFIIAASFPTSGTGIGTNPLVVITFPLVVRAFGVIASAFGLLLVRCNETGSLSSAVLRGYLSTAAIILSALAGTSYWLFGEHFLSLFGVGALGLISVLFAAHAVLVPLGRRSTAMRDHTESVRLGSGALAAVGLGVGFQAALVPFSILCVAVAIAVCIGEQSGLGLGVSLLMFALASLSVTPFVQSIATLGSIADGARGIANMTNADGELKRRSARLDEASFLSSTVARQFAMFSGACSTLLVAWAIDSEGHLLVSAAEPGPVSSTLIWCGALGAAVALGYGGSVARAAGRGARDVSDEVERQLRGFPREHGIAIVPADYTPSYKSCVELTTTVSLRKIFVPIAIGLAAPALLGLGLRQLFRTAQPQLVSQGLSWFVVFASLSGLTLSLVLDTARATLSLVRRAHRGKDNAKASTRTITADALSDIFGNAAGPALQLLVKATAAAALLVTPFLL